MHIKKAMQQANLQFQVIERGAKIVNETELSAALKTVSNSKRGRKPKSPKKC